IVFMEVKKKALTRKAAAGDNVSLAVDFSRSLIASQKQLGEHELYLYENEEIVLRKYQSKKKSKKGELARIQRQNRIIERVSIAFPEYGFLTDKQTVSSILESLTVGTVHAYDLAREHELNELNDLGEKLWEQLDRLAKYEGEEYFRKPYHDSTFYSMQQLLTIISDSHSTESFVDNLMATKHLTMNTNDFYYEYENLKGLRRKASP